MSDTHDLDGANARIRALEAQLAHERRKTAEAHALIDRCLSSISNVLLWALDGRREQLLGWCRSLAQLVERAQRRDTTTQQEKHHG